MERGVDQSKSKVGFRIRPPPSARGTGSDGKVLRDCRVGVFVHPEVDASGDHPRQAMEFNSASAWTSVKGVYESG